MANTEVELQKIVKCTQDQYDALVNNFSVNGQSYDNNAIYLVENSDPIATQSWVTNKEYLTQSSLSDYSVVRMNRTNTGWLTISGQMEADSFYASSDIRLKKNIVPYKCDKSILDLEVKEFDYKNTNEHTIGCIAQDLQKICPQIVHESEDGYLRINESKIVYLLLDEVKELKKEINELKSLLNKQ